MINSPIFKFFEKQKAYLIIGFFCLCYINVYSQDQKESDSLKKVFKDNTYDRSLKLRILDDITFYETDTDEIIIYSKELIASAKEMDSIKFVFKGYLQLGNGYRLKSELSKALENYFIASKIAVDIKSVDKQAAVKVAIADAYSIMGDSKNAVAYYRKGIYLFKSDDEINTVSLASAQLNLGDEYYNQKKLDSALYYFSESGKLFKKADYEVGVAYNLGNVGLVYAEKGENEKAENNLNEAIKVLTENEDFYPICVYLNAIADVYSEKGLNKKALQYANRSLSLAKEYGLKEQIGDGYLKLSNLYSKRNQYKTSLNLYKKHIVYRDSVQNSLEIKEFEVKEKEKEKEIAVAKKEALINIQKEEAKTQKVIAIGIGVALFLIAIFAIFLFRNNRVIAKEKKRSDGLLKNILPDETAEELKENGTVKAKRFESVSVLFTDFKGFTQFSETLSPEELVKSIDFYFSKFDEIIEEHRLEKIKTVGDAYMCAGGLPFPSKDHAYKMVLAALDIVDFVKASMNNQSIEKAKLDIRVGIHTGSVVAGVVGTKKFAYDIWGDTVNTASRMESSGAVSRVNISDSTYQLLKDNPNFIFEPRGAIEAKGKGKIDMYFVNRKV
ncbi:MAG: adenylate/guanylate cyclase domain-containing protein [Polaribacter sp.]